MLDVWFILTGLILIFFAALPIGYILIVLCTRYRDLNNLIESIMAVMFFLTTVIWMPGMATGVREWVLLLNPFFHFLEIISDPFIGQAVDSINWIVAFSIGFFTWIISYILFGYYGRRVLIWL